VFCKHSDTNSHIHTHTHTHSLFRTTTRIAIVPLCF